MKKNRKVISLIAVIALLILIVLFSRANREPVAQEVPFSSEKVAVSTLNIEDNPDTVNELLGYPAGLPIETENITEETKLAYPERGVVLYSIVYTSDKAAKTLDELYKSYLQDAGYTLTALTESAQDIFIHGQKDNDDIAVVISDTSDGRIIKLAITDRT